MEENKVKTILNVSNQANLILTCGVKLYQANIIAILGESSLNNDISCPLEELPDKVKLIMKISKTGEIYIADINNADISKDVTLFADKKFSHSEEGGH